MKISNHIFKQLTILLSISTVMSISAQKEWSLQECIDYALIHNLEIKDLHYAQNSNKETYRQAIRDLLPRVDGYTDYNIRYGRSINPNDNSITNSDFFSNNYSLNGTLDLFQGFKKINTLRASKFLYQATKEDILQKKFLLSFSVMNAYYDIRYYDGLATIAQEQYEISKTNYKLVKHQIELGIKAKGDRYEAESTLLKDELTHTQYTNQLQAAKLKLMQEMNFLNKETIAIHSLLASTKIVEIKTQHIDSIYQTAKATVPLLKAQQYRVKAAKKQLAVERGNYYPALSMFASHGTGYFETRVDANNIIKPFKTQLDENRSSRIGISVEIPIFNKGSVRSRVKQQKIAWLRAKNELNIQEQILFQQVQQLIQESNALKIEYTQSTKQVLLQEQAFHIAQKRYEKGLITIAELNQAKTVLATSKNNELQIHLKSQINDSTLDFYKGISTINTLLKK